MIYRPPFKCIHISRTSVMHRIVFDYAQWTIEAWRGDITPFSNVYQRAPTLRAVKEIIDSISGTEIVPSTSIGVMMDGIMMSMQSEADWVMVILSESPDTFVRKI
jgi:hypothetical protein